MSDESTPPPLRAVLYDVHGNLPALEAVLDDAQAAGAEAFVLGGDYALFGAWPRETVALLRTLAATWIRGNGERWTADPTSAPEQALIRRAIADCRERLGDPMVEELRQLPERAEIGDVLFCHASPRSDTETFGPTKSEHDSDLVRGTQHSILTFGHSHIQFARSGASRRLVNPGSVGMPFDRDRRAAYALWEGRGEFELRRVEYDSDAYANALRERLVTTLQDSVETLAPRIEQAAFVN